MKTFFDYSFTSKNFDDSDTVKDFTMDKLDHHLKKFLPEDTKITVSFIETGFKKKVEITAHVNKRLVRAEVSNKESMQGAVDESIDVLTKQLRRYKDKLIAISKKNSSFSNELKTISDLPENDVDTEDISDLNTQDEKNIKIERVKSFDVKPMSAEEAAMEMCLLDHDFYVFVNSGTGKVNVIYKRKNGSYGLIEPRY